MAQRISGVDGAVNGDGAGAIFAASEKMLGRTANLVRILAHSPDLARWFLG